MAEQDNANTNKQIRTVIKKIAATHGIDIIDIMYASVKKGSVDLTARTCTVIPITGKSDTEIEGVKLQSDDSDGELKAPADESTVVVGMSSAVDAFVFLFSDIDSISWKGGNFGGLVKVEDVTTKLNNIENKLNDLINSYTAHTHVATLAVSGASAAGTTNPAIIVPPINTLTPTKKSDIENTKIKHGDK
jgi:hypothetical protein